MRNGELRESLRQGCQDIVVKFGRRSHACVAELYRSAVRPVSQPPATSTPPPTDAAAPELTGVWHGTIHIDGIPLEGADKRVMLELRDDGSFYCPTYDLVTMASDSPSVGWATREGDTMLFTMEAETGKQIRTFLFSLVPLSDDR